MTKKYLCRSDISITIRERTVEANSSIIGRHALVRKYGGRTAYFGTCVFFNPPGLAPVGYGNRVSVVWYLTLIYYIGHNWSFWLRNLEINVNKRLLLA